MGSEERLCWGLGAEYDSVGSYGEPLRLGMVLLGSAMVALGVGRDGDMGREKWCWVRQGDLHLGVWVAVSEVLTLEGGGGGVY